MHIHDNFQKTINPYWTQVYIGGGTAQIKDSHLLLGFNSARKGQYTDAQIDDYTMLSRSSYLWKPPVRMVIRARFSLPEYSADQPLSSFKGTAGFGFWNNPFSLKGDIHALPEAIWFFYSAPPSNMSLVSNIKGYGWKAQSLHTMRLGTIAYTLPLSAAMLYGKVSNDFRYSSILMEKFSGANEALIETDITNWHTYVLEWHKNESIFWVDDKKILHVQQSPTRPLGLVVWVDNQYAVATPTGLFRFGTVNTGSQWMEINDLQVKSL